LSRYEQSVLKSELTLDKKVYFVDNGLIHALNYTYHDDYGKLLENNIFLWLRGRASFQRGLYYFKNKSECDFVVFDRDKPVKLVQSCWDVSGQNTLKREIKGLVEAAKYFNCTDLTIINIDAEMEIPNGELSIKVIPAWKFYLQ
jgi:predicted AAA+ superfamily ATPase